MKASARAFGQAIYKGDATAARALVVESETSDKLVDALSAMTVANEKFALAMQSKFKEEASRPGAAGGAGANAFQWVKSIDEAEVKVDGDAATLQPPPIKAEPVRPAPGAGTRPGGPAAGAPRTIPTTPIHLKRVEGKWKTDLSQMPGVNNDPARAAQLFASMAKAYEETAAEVKDGKYRTAREAHAAVGRKVFSALGGGTGTAGAGSGNPATRPAGPPR